VLACASGSVQTVFFGRWGLVLLLSLAVAFVSAQRPRYLFASSRNTSTAEDQICDPLADYFLGMEDYPEAIRRHQAIIRDHPDNALAHYHLGFAYGVTGDHQRELAEYDEAVSLGLSDWQLFLNLGLLDMEEDHPEQASEVLRLATLLGPYRPETHFNLGLVYEQLGMFQKAEQELLLSLRLDPKQADARNTLGVVYAEEGNYQRAHDEWLDLASTDPDFTPARANLAILDRVERGEIKGPGRLSGFAHAP
jgi:tetratricopeptide (TPR) repeat protein